MGGQTRAPGAAANGRKGEQNVGKGRKGEKTEERESKESSEGYRRDDKDAEEAGNRQESKVKMEQSAVRSIAIPPAPLFLFLSLSSLDRTKCSGQQGDIPAHTR